MNDSLALSSPNPPLDSLPHQNQAPLNPQMFGLTAELLAPPKACVGDTLPITVRISWKTSPEPWLAVPQNSMETRGLHQISMGASQDRKIQDGQEQPQILLHYQVAATDTGVLQIPAMTYRMQMPLAQSQGLAPVEVQTQSQALSVEQPTSWFVIGGIGLGVLGVIFLLIFAWRKRKLQRTRREQALRKETDFRTQLKELSQRIQVADPRNWVVQLEQLVLAWRVMRQENALWLPEDLRMKQDQDIWGPLDKAFSAARYGGGPKDSWQNKELLQQVQQVLNIQDEDDEL